MATSKARGRSKKPGADSAAGSELRNYQLDKSIRQEELATVYAASHTMLDRPVEVHILRRTDWISASRFQLAARLSAHLNHPSLLPVIDAGHDEQFGDYLVTPTLEARTLADVLTEGPLDPLSALRIITQVASALDYLHDHQIIHRDVQPANILLTSEGVAYLTNLSLAASPDTPDLSSVAEADYLTPYSAPEQHLDQSEADPTLDVYSMGAVMYHMLSGEVPPAPDTELPPLANTDPSLEAMDQVLQHMMATDPTLRTTTPSAAIVVMRQALRGHIDSATEDMEESRWELVAEWLENPLETVLGNVLKTRAQSEPEHAILAEDTEDAAAVEVTADTLDEEPASGDALHSFQEYMGRSRARADVLHRADTIRRVLNRWSRKGFFRRQSLGYIIQLEQIVSYNIYFYELHTLYETRTKPTVRQRIANVEDRRSVVPPPDVWEAIVPDTAPFTTVKQQELVLPNSTQVFTCTTCGGEGEVSCDTCKGTGMIERSQKVRNPDGSTGHETIPGQCPACRGYGKLKCPTCEGNGNLVEEAVFTWSRRARNWQNTDDIEDLPQLALQQRATLVCTTEINPYKGVWHSVAPLDELLRAAVADVQHDGDTRLAAAKLEIRGVPITEVDYQLSGKSGRLYLIGHDSELVGDWSLYNPERIALVALGVVVALVLLVVGAVVLF
jgi:serine/threonine protein kinase